MPAGHNKSPLERQVPSTRGARHPPSPSPKIVDATAASRRVNNARVLRKGQGRGLPESPAAGEAISAADCRTRGRPPPPVVSGRGGSVGSGAATRMLMTSGFRTRSGRCRTRRAWCSSLRAGCYSSRPGSWFRCRTPDPPDPCSSCNPWSGCPAPPWCPCR